MERGGSKKLLRSERGRGGERKRVREGERGEGREVGKEEERERDSAYPYLDRLSGGGTEPVPVRTED